jgi:hypothetical protein
LYYLGLSFSPESWSGYSAAEEDKTMIRKNTWIMVGLLALLVASAILIPRLQGSATHETTVPTLGDPLIPAEQANITGMRLTGIIGKPIILKKNAQGVWTVIDPQGLTYDNSQLNSAVGVLTSSAVLSPLPTQPPSDVMGLTDPTYIIQLTLENGTEIVMKVGKQSPTGSGYYIQQDSNPAVIISRNPIINLVELFTAGTASPTPLGY